MYRGYGAQLIPSDSTLSSDTQLFHRGPTIVQIDRWVRKPRKTRSGGRDATSSPRPTGRVVQSRPTVGLCRKKTESRGVNIIRAREGHRCGRRLNTTATPLRPFDFFLRVPSSAERQERRLGHSPRSSEKNFPLFLPFPLP